MGQVPLLRQTEFPRVIGIANVSVSLWRILKWKVIAVGSREKRKGVLVLLNYLLASAVERYGASVPPEVMEEVDTLVKKVMTATEDEWHEIFMSSFKRLRGVPLNGANGGFQGIDRAAYKAGYTPFGYAILCSIARQSERLDHAIGGCWDSLSEVIKDGIEIAFEGLDDVGRHGIVHHGHAPEGSNSSTNE